MNFDENPSINRFKRLKNMAKHLYFIIIYQIRKIIFSHH
jgi:hypothetical protein